MSVSRYAAHLALPAIESAGQRRIRAAHVLLIGAGGLGCPVALYLAAAGVGHLTVCDFDEIVEHNLPRQILYRTIDIGRRKVDVLQERLAEINDQVKIATVRERIGVEQLDTLLPPCDLLIDASDNYGTRLAINRACLKFAKTWVMGAAVRLEGQLAILRPGGPCYRCIYGDVAETLEDCSGPGVFAPLTGMLGCAMANQALLLLAGQTPPPTGLYVIDAEHMQWHRLAVLAKAGCADCGNA